MPDSGLLVLSCISLVVGATLVLSSGRLLKLSARLNRPVGTLDEWLIRHRYVMGWLAFAASYAFFRLSLLLPTL